MSLQATETSTATAPAPTKTDTRWRFSADKSANLASTVFIASGILWLLVSTLLTLITQFKLFSPDFMGDWRWLTYGRVYPMAQNAFVFGWLSMAGMGILTWLWARLMKGKVKGQLLLVSGAMLWNLGVALGVVGIMTSFSRGTEWLDMPLLSYVIFLLAIPPVLQSMYYSAKASKNKNLYISSWYAGAAIIWLFCLLATTLLPTQSGISSATYAAWFGHGIIGLWILPVGLATAYYLIPKLTGRPVFSKHLAPLGFWTFALFMCWSGADQLIGSPIPQWLSVISIGFSVLMLIPVSVITVNLLLSSRNLDRSASGSPAARFIFFAVISFSLYGLLDALHPLRWWNEITQFTLFQSAHLQLGIYAFASMMAFGAIYYIMPRISKSAWPNPSLIRFHYLLAAVGIGLFITAHWFGGVFQGTALMDATVPTQEAVSSLWLSLGILGFLCIAAGHLLFAYLFYGNLIKTSN